MLINLNNKYKNYFLYQNNRQTSLNIEHTICPSRNESKSFFCCIYFAFAFSRSSALPPKLFKKSSFSQPCPLIFNAVDDDEVETQPLNFLENLRTPLLLLNPFDDGVVSERAINASAVNFILIIVAS